MCKVLVPNCQYRTDRPNGQITPVTLTFRPMSSVIYKAVIINLFFPVDERPISRHEDESLACPGPLTLPGLFNLLEGHAFDRDNEPTLPCKLCHMAIDGRSSL
jgi:hypothetical protein